MTIKLNPGALAAAVTLPSIAGDTARARVPQMAPPGLTPLTPPGQPAKIRLQTDAPHPLRQAFFADKQRELLTALEWRQDNPLLQTEHAACKAVLQLLARLSDATAAG